MLTSFVKRLQHGTSMIEVLVTVVILTFGVLGLFGLQSRLQLSEMESYQRAQALVLLEDMANRISTNRSAAASYVTGTSNPLGTGHTCDTSAADTRQSQDSCEWSKALQGAAETTGTTKIGAMLGGRGCVESLGNNEYLVTVAWQGMGPISAPPASVACGANLYNGGSVCTSDRCRRTLTTIVRIATLT